MTGITVKVLEEAEDMLGKMLLKYHDGLDKAYMKADGPLTIDLKVKFSVNDSGDMEVETAINFVTDRIKNSFKRTIRESQEGLFDIKLKEPGPYVHRERGNIPVQFWPKFNGWRFAA